MSPTCTIERVRPWLTHGFGAVIKALINHLPNFWEQITRPSFIKIVSFGTVVREKDDHSVIQGIDLG